MAKCLESSEQYGNQLQNLLSLQANRFWQETFLIDKNIVLIGVQYRSLVYQIDVYKLLLNLDVSFSWWILAVSELSFLLDLVSLCTVQSNKYFLWKYTLYACLFKFNLLATCKGSCIFKAIISSSSITLVNPADGRGAHLWQCVTLGGCPDLQSVLLLVHC